MTDNDIIKALECCISDKVTCLECPYNPDKHIIDEKFEIMPNGKSYDDLCCDEWLKLDLFALINRLKDENEDLRQIVFTDRSEAIKNLKSEARKEFAERFKENFDTYTDDQEWQVSNIKNLADNLLEEMEKEI